MPFPIYRKEAAADGCGLRGIVCVGRVRGLGRGFSHSPSLHSLVFLISSEWIQKTHTEQSGRASTEQSGVLSQGLRGDPVLIYRVARLSIISEDFRSSSFPGGILFCPGS